MAESLSVHLPQRLPPEVVRLVSSSSSTSLSPSSEALESAVDVLTAWLALPVCTPEEASSSSFLSPLERHVRSYEASSSSSSFLPCERREKEEREDMKKRCREDRRTSEETLKKGEREGDHDNAQKRSDEVEVYVQPVSVLMDRLMLLYPFLLQNLDHSPQLASVTCDIFLNLLEATSLVLIEAQKDLEEFYEHDQDKKHTANPLSSSSSLPPCSPPPVPSFASFVESQTPFTFLTACIPSSSSSSFSSLEMSSHIKTTVTSPPNCFYPPSSLPHILGVSLPLPLLPTLCSSSSSQLSQKGRSSLRFPLISLLEALCRTAKPKELFISLSSSFSSSSLVLPSLRLLLLPALAACTGRIGRRQRPRFIAQASSLVLHAFLKRSTVERHTHFLQTQIRSTGRRKRRRRGQEKKEKKTSEEDTEEYTRKEDERKEQEKEKKERRTPIDVILRDSDRDGPHDKDKREEEEEERDYVPFFLYEYPLISPWLRTFSYVYSKSISRFLFPPSELQTARRYQRRVSRLLSFITSSSSCSSSSFASCPKEQQRLNCVSTSSSSSCLSFSSILLPCDVSLPATAVLQGLVAFVRCMTCFIWMKRSPRGEGEGGEERESEHVDEKQEEERDEMDPHAVGPLTLLAVCLRVLESFTPLIPDCHLLASVPGIYSYLASPSSSLASSTSSSFSFASTFQAKTKEKEKEEMSRMSSRPTPQRAACCDRMKEGGGEEEKKKKEEEEEIRVAMMARSMLTDFAEARKRILSMRADRALPQSRQPSTSSSSSHGNTFSSFSSSSSSSSSVHREGLSSAVTSPFSSSSSSPCFHHRHANLSDPAVSLLSSLLSSLTSLLWCTACLHERYRYGGVYLSLTGRLNTATMPASSSDSGDLEISSFSLSFFSYLLLSFPYLFYEVLPLPSPLSRLSRATIAFKSSFLLLSYVNPHAAKDLLRRSTKKMSMINTEKEQTTSIFHPQDGKNSQNRQEKELENEDLMYLETRGGASDAVYTAGLPDRHTWLVQRKAEQLCLLATDFLSLSHADLSRRGRSSSCALSDLFSLQYTQQGGGEEGGQAPQQAQERDQKKKEISLSLSPSASPEKKQKCVDLPSQPSHLDTSQPSSRNIGRDLSFIEKYRKALSPPLQDVQMLYECFEEVTGLYPLRTQEDFFLSLICQPPPLPDTAIGAILILFKKRWCDLVLSVRKSQLIEMQRKETPSSSSCSSSSSSSSSVLLTETCVSQRREADLGVEGRGEEEKSEISQRETKGEKEKDGEGATNVRGGVDTPEICGEKESTVEEGQKENALVFWNVIKCVLIDRKEEEERIVDSSERLTTLLNWLKLCMYTPASFSSSSLSNSCVVKREDSSSSSSFSSSRALETSLHEKKKKEKKCIEDDGEKEEERAKKISTCLQAVEPPPGSFTSLPFLQFGRYVWKRGRKELDRILDRLTSQIDIELLLLQGKKEREEERNNKRGLVQAKNEEAINTQRKTGKARIEEEEEEEEKDDEEKKNLSHGRGREILSDDLLEVVIPEQRQKGGEEGEKKKKITMKRRDEEELKLALVQAALRDVRDLSRHITY
ncbi:hypothetical protein CSUI_002698 [Cystoisospora suis]|uniref:Uncharacterized protein n=1 Tax=Cystoisospora suis TaxID=483139 RepID=A0A2C6KT07_9APIC|nr:hypothetical protein CSUI_002698 [Cystoisospora suis]